MSRLSDEVMLAPDLLRHEVRSLLLNAVRRKRVAPDHIPWGPAPLRPVADPLRRRGDDRDVIALAERHGLTPYDAVYLWLAPRRRSRWPRSTGACGKPLAPKASPFCRRGMTPSELAKLHPQLFHLCERDAVDAILRHGLWSTRRLLAGAALSVEEREVLLARRRPAALRLRHAEFGPVTINDNLPLSEKKLAAASMTG